MNEYEAVAKLVTVGFWAPWKAYHQVAKRSAARGEQQPESKPSSGIMPQLLALHSTRRR